MFMPLYPDMVYIKILLHLYQLKILKVSRFWKRINNFLSITGHTVAVKTGTTDNKKDNLTLGYTPSYVVATWVGNNDNTPMNKNLASGLSGAAPMWNRIMSLTLQGKPAEVFVIPENITFINYRRCSVSEYFIKGSNIP